jgi:hypothetical protein
MEHPVARASFAITLLLSIATLFWATKGLDGTEFSGGALTGRLLDATNLALVVYGVALLVFLWLPKVAATLSWVASALCFPLLAYFFAPRLFRAATGLLWPTAQWSVPLSRSVNWSCMTILPLLAIFASAVLALFLFQLAPPAPQPSR